MNKIITKNERDYELIQSEINAWLSAITEAATLLKFLSSLNRNEIGIKIGISETEQRITRYKENYKKASRKLESL